MAVNFTSQPLTLYGHTHSIYRGVFSPDGSRIVTASRDTAARLSLANHLFVIFYKEPTLKRKFGAAYEDDLKRVPRWIPKIR